jgi:hypothetical protein
MAYVQSTFNISGNERIREIHQDCWRLPESSIGHEKTSQIIRGYVNWAMACMQSTINTGNLLSPEKISCYNVRIEGLHKVGGLSS